MDVILPAGVPVELYFASGIPAGIQLKVHNIASNDVRLASIESGLAADHVVIGPYGCAVNDSSEMQGWALSLSGGAINVRRA